jgi:apolipoprotein N-acyltransferase
MTRRSIESPLLGEGETVPSLIPAGIETRANRREQTHAAGLSLIENVGWILVAALAFHVAYFSSATSFLILLYVFAVLQLARNASGRKAFYSGLTVGLLIAAGRLEFFWNIFGGGCAVLWLVYAFWIGLFTALARLCSERFGSVWGLLPIPFVWCGLEYFRSELYYLRFSWLTPGYAFALAPGFVPFQHFGVYGISFLLAGIAGLAAGLRDKSTIWALVAICCGSGFLLGFADSRKQDTAPRVQVQVAGVQMEFPSEQEVLVRLNELVRKYPKSELLVLSEYTFNDSVPEKVKNWCRQHQRYLIVGGKDPAPGGNYYDTGFVISPTGEIVFRQGKKVPIQLFKDGLPAAEQKVWNSPWGKIGICICYDLSYRRVTDRLVEQGAEALIVPTMDMVEWGKRQHELHARVAPVRAAEYGIPVFRVASSGISQLIDARARVVASAPCPGEGAMLGGWLQMCGAGHLPLDRWFAPFATFIAGLITMVILFLRGRPLRAAAGRRCHSLLTSTAT